MVSEVHDFPHAKHVVQTFELSPCLEFCFHLFLVLGTHLAVFGTAPGLMLGGHSQGTGGSCIVAHGTRATCEQSTFSAYFSVSNFLFL